MTRFTIFLLAVYGFSSAPAFSQSNLRYHRADGYKGIWFELGQKSYYGDKYSGGLGTYTAKHRPLAIYDSVSNKTFFVYGGTTAASQRHLLCMVSYFDHETRSVPRPVIVHDKEGVDDPHDNPSLMLDEEGYVWVFVSGRGRHRPGYKYRSTQPHAIDTFQLVAEEEMTYPQPWYLPGKGYFHFFTKYTGMRQLYFETSQDGFRWSRDQQLAGIRRIEDDLAGHYQVSATDGNRVATFFSWHPNGNVDRRTNLYYLESYDLGKTWQTVEGKPAGIPVTEVDNAARVKDYFGKQKNVYLKDINFDQQGHPVGLFLLSNDHKPGPDNGLRHWYVAHWNNNEWQIKPVATSDHNYDMGSLYIEQNYWWVIAPTAPGPQPWSVGGEMVIWESSNQGKSWQQVMQVTSESRFSHSYLRRPENAHREFYGFWADAYPDELSISHLYFMNQAGTVFQLPYEMDGQIFSFR